MNICAIIPSLNPDEKIIDVVKGLKEKGFYKIIVVNDGSNSDHYFRMLESDCDILTHYKNLGKGRAMKTAFNYYMNKYSDCCVGVVIVDSDNQHIPCDVVKCCEDLLKHPDSMVLGVRNFKGDNVPLHNKLGNRITAFVFTALCGIKVSDTQTGLRAIGNSAIADFLEVKGERFEYETNMLLETKKEDIELREVPITTVYLEDNKSSHFNVFTDSLSIYKVLLSYLSSSILSTGIDFLTFFISLKIFHFLSSELNILIATVISRALSSLCNYLMNHKVVFRSHSGIKNTIAKYYVLCIIQLLMSYGGVYALHTCLNWNEMIAKVVVDLLLFIVSFQIQREWVFRNRKQRGEL